MKVLYKGKPHLVVETDPSGYGYGIKPCDGDPNNPMIMWVGKHEVTEYTKDIPERKETETNPILNNVMSLLEKQTLKGIEKYGNTVKATDYTMVGWLEHLQMELVDALVYTETLKAKVKDVEKVLG